jgi:hypothetical protein
LVTEALEHAVAAIETWLRDGIDEAMNRSNRSVEDQFV